MAEVIEAQQAFEKALEALGAVSDVEEAQAERLVHDACAAIDMLADAMQALPEARAAQNEASSPLAWADAVSASWENVAKAHLGAKIARHLDSFAPNLCAPWLDGLKLLASRAVVAKGMRDIFEAVAERKGTARGFLSTSWPELKDRGGLRASRWRARVSAAEFLSSLAEYDLAGSKLDERSLEELLHALIYGMALADSQWQVRQAVVSSVARLLTTSRGFLSNASWANLTWGMLAICVDPQPEVKETAIDATIQHLLPPSASHSKVVVQGLLDGFINAAFAEAESPKENNTLLSAVHAAVLLELAPHQTAFEVEDDGNVSLDRIPIVVVAASFSLAKFEANQNRSYCARLVQLLRSLGSYLISLLAMLNPAMALYECDKLARYCNGRGVLDDVTASKLESVPIATCLKGLLIALEASESNTKSSDSDDVSVGDLQLDGLQHVSEVLRIPLQLTRNYKDEKTDGEVKNYLSCGKLYLRLAFTLVKSRVWTAQQAWNKEELMYNIFLSFAALASGIIESERTWVDETGLCKLCNDLLVCFSEALESESSPTEDEAVSPSRRTHNKVSSIETLVLRFLPKVLSSAIAVLKAGTRSVNRDLAAPVPKVDDLPLAIISAHQLRWCLLQVHYPSFKPHSEMVIRTALTALDHYSPSIKREGMKAFIHLAKNVSATELRWFRDAILDAVTRSLIGCDDLWPLAVETAVALVTQIEGGNPRGQWYGAIMKEMLEDLDRHKSDKARRITWLQIVTPQLESMGIFLVAHFKRLLPLLYHWLHAQDESTQLLVLSNLSMIIKSTWPRIPFHASRMQEELTRAKKDGQERKSSPEVLAAIDTVERLLKLTTSSTIRGVPLLHLD